MAKSFQFSLCQETVIEIVHLAHKKDPKNLLEDKTIPLENANKHNSSNKPKSLLPTCLEVLR
jgi:hypothetical protein